MITSFFKPKSDAASSSTTVSRACPQCTLLTDDATRTHCELCGKELDEPQPAKRHKATDAEANPPTPAASTAPAAAPPPLRFTRPGQFGDFKPKGFVPASTLVVSPGAVPRLLPPPTLRVEFKHLVPGENVLVIRNALTTSQAMVAELLTTTQQHLQRVQASGRGAIWVERNKTIPQTLLHAQTRMALRASAEALRSAASASMMRLPYAAMPPPSAVKACRLLPRGSTPAEQPSIVTPYRKASASRRCIPPPRSWAVQWLMLLPAVSVTTAL